MKSRTRRILIHSAAVAIAFAPEAVAAQQRTFNLPAQPATKSIPEFARQAGIQIVAPGGKLRKFRTPAVKGTYDARAVLRLLIEGTSLRVVKDDGAAITLAMRDEGTITRIAAVATEPARRETPRAAPPKPEVGLEDIVVTAQKREQRLQDIGIAVTAIGKEGLSMLGRQDVTALTNQVPSLQVQQYSPVITIFNIRGVSQNDFASLQEAPIAFYNDEVYIAALGAISGQTYDLQRVEVLRGPQGTLFGRNATGGLIQVVTAKPTKNLEGFVSLTGASYDQISTEGAISGPLSDTVRARLAFATNDHDGYLRNLAGPDFGTARFRAARFQVEADVGTRGKLLFKLEGMRNDHEVSGGYTNIPATFNSDGLGVALSTPDDPFVGSYDSKGLFDRKSINAMVRYDHDLGFGQFTSISDYQWLKTAYREDSDATAIPTNFVEVYGRNNRSQWSQEFRISGTTPRLTWLVGVFGFGIHHKNRTVFDALPNVLYNLYAYDTYKQNTTSLAVFAQGEYKLNDVFTVIFGGRYSSDWKKYKLTNDQYSPLFPFIWDNSQVFSAAQYPYADRFFGNYSGKIQIDARPNEDTLLYATISRGTKSGGFGVQSIGPIVPDRLPYDQEVLTNYEAGFKLTLAQKKVTFNGSLFHYDYKDYQAFTAVGLSQFLTNHPAEINGLELELNLQPIQPLNINLFGTNLFKAKVEGIQLPGPNPFGAATGRIVDRRMPQAPEWSLGGTVSYDLDLGNVGSLLLATNWKYDSKQYFSAFNAPIDRESGHLVGNVRVTFTPAESPLQAAFFINNVTNKYYRLYNTDQSLTAGVGDSVYAPPRIYGGSVTYRFGY